MVFTDHKNNLFTGAMLDNKRINKKLLRWSLEIEEYGVGSRIERRWIKGVDNILGDAPSRNPPTRDEVRDLPVASGPIKRVIHDMFFNPDAPEAEQAELQVFLKSFNEHEPDRKAELSKRSQDQPVCAQGSARAY